METGMLSRLIITDETNNLDTRKQKDEASVAENLSGK